ncbi:hypothetical protein ACFQ5M_12995 [Agrilactobacillus yilanensis]|uniref:Uncharacterized protein n=1 Tax=Agrilactobacillus yilanensis TaxID=2485997 RepID=A0ABW4JBN1_9LACO|nr:hypothetical protein [Agrilactobacillus yilanensis]
MAEDFEHALTQLVAGEIDEIKVEPKDFLKFRRFWQERPERKEIIGIAQRNGQIIYEFRENASN